MQNFTGRWRKYINFAYPLSKIMCNVNDKKIKGIFFDRRNLHILLYLSVLLLVYIQQILRHNVCVLYCVGSRYVGLDIHCTLYCPKKGKRVGTNVHYDTKLLQVASANSRLRVHYTM